MHLRPEQHIGRANGEKVHNSDLGQKGRRSAFRRLRTSVVMMVKVGRGPSSPIGSDPPNVKKVCVAAPRTFVRATGGGPEANWEPFVRWPTLAGEAQWLVQVWAAVRRFQLQAPDERAEGLPEALGGAECR